LMRAIPFVLEMLFSRYSCPLYMKCSLTHSSSFNNRKFVDDGQVSSVHDVDENLRGFGRRRRPKAEIDNTRRC